MENPNQEKIMVVIEGGTASGKTYIAKKMIAAIKEVVEKEIPAERKGKLFIQIFTD
jgi:uridine kinase